MKNIIYTILVCSLFVAACEDAIEVPLDEADALITVDAWLTDIESETQTIRLTRSQPYFDSLAVLGVTGAEVRITSSNGKVYSFQDTADSGNYTLAATDESEWYAEPVSTTYSLDIGIEEVTLTASAEKNRVPQIDSIFQELRIDDPFVDDGIFCNLFATDLLGLGDTYWIKTYKNGDYLNRPGEINIAFDAGFSSGAETDNLVFIQPIQELNNPVDDNSAPIPWQDGETIRVELHSISNAGFFYLEILRDQLLNSSSGIFAEPQANTRGNITSSDGKVVLGFFNVSATSIIEEVIGE